MKEWNKINQELKNENLKFIKIAKKIVSITWPQRDTREIYTNK